MIGLAMMLADVTAQAKRYSGRDPAPTDTVWTDLHIDREDFIEFCVELESAHGVDLRPVFERGGEFRDATIAEVASYIDAKLQRG